MIVIGYQGIGKTTLAGKGCLGVIDLESSWFKVDGKRAENWADTYCRIAEGLSRQGYVVMIASHAAIQEILLTSKEQVVSIFPSLDIRDEWIERLRTRFETTGNPKDLAAWKGAEAGYEKEIAVLKSRPFRNHEIVDMDYDLLDILLGESVK